MGRKLRNLISDFLEYLSMRIKYGSIFEPLNADDIYERLLTIENTAECEGVELSADSLGQILVRSIEMFEEQRMLYMPISEEDCAELWTETICDAFFEETNKSYKGVKQ